MKAEATFTSLSHANVSPCLERQIAANKFGVLQGPISHKDIASVTLGILPMIPGLSRLKLRVERRHLCDYKLQNQQNYCPSAFMQLSVSCTSTPSTAGIYG